MIDTNKATTIYGKYCAGEKVTPEEYNELMEYASRFNTPKLVEEAKETTNA